MSIKFIKYNSIDNLYNKELQSFKDSVLYNPLDTWVVTPKIDGSNMTILFDDNGEPYAAKRNAVLDPNEDFFNYQSIMSKYNTVFCALRKEILQDFPEFEGEPVVDISIHGELCGGYFPGMPVLSGAKKVQKSVNYSNKNEFIVFDIRLYINEVKYYYLKHTDVIYYCNERLHVVPILYTGSLNDCLTWSSQHNADLDETWKIFGMPTDGGPDNIREGHVIKPNRTIFKGDSRVIFKDKNEKFQDKSRSKRPKAAVVYSDVLNVLIETIPLYVNENRFNSVTSKIGEYSIRDFARIMTDMSDDILEDIKKTDEMYLDLCSADKEILKKAIVKRVSTYMGANKAILF